MAVLRWALAALALAAGCSDPLVDAGYRGEPLFTFRGRVLQLSGTLASDDPIRVSLFWSPSGRTDVTQDQLVEQTTVTAGITLPATFALHVFTPPPADVLTPDGYGVALALIYQDRDHDGRLSPGELLGGSSDRAVVYAPEPIDAGRSPLGEPLEAGFRLLRIPARCASSGHGCPLPIGAACTTDADCGGLHCFTTEELHDEVPGGYCAQWVAAATCVPQGAALLALGGVPIFLKACQRNDQCRVDEGWECNTGVLACLPVGATANASEDPREYGPCQASADCLPGWVCDEQLFMCIPDEPVSLELLEGFKVRLFCAPE